MLPPLIDKKLTEAVQQHEELERQLSDAEVIAQPSRFRAISREHGALAKLVMSSISI